MWIILAALLFLTIDLFLFPRVLPYEMTLEPHQSWTLSENSSSVASDSQFFRLGEWEGAWSPSNGLGRVRALKLQEDVSPHEVAWRDAAHNSIVVEGVRGKLFELVGEQYPFWVRDRLFTMDENRMTLSAWGPTGQALWSKSFASLVTAIDASQLFTVVGTLDGRVQVFDNKGASAGEFQPGGSRLSVVYNVSLSSDDRRILVLAGLDPKRFLILERGGSDYRPVYHRPLRENHPWPTPLGFLNGKDIAYYEKVGSLGLVNPASPERETDIAIQGEIGDVVSAEGEKLIFLLDKGTPLGVLRVASTDGTPVLALPYQGSNAFLKLSRHELLLGLDQSLLLFDVRFQ